MKWLTSKIKENRESEGLITAPNRQFLSPVIIVDDDGNERLANYTYGMLDPDDFKEYKIRAEIETKSSDTEGRMPYTFYTIDSNLDPDGELAIQVPRGNVNLYDFVVRELDIGDLDIYPVSENNDSLKIAEKINGREFITYNDNVYRIDDNLPLEYVYKYIKESKPDDSIICYFKYDDTLNLSVPYQRLAEELMKVSLNTDNEEIRDKIQLFIYKLNNDSFNKGTEFLSAHAQLDDDFHLFNCDTHDGSSLCIVTNGVPNPSQLSNILVDQEYYAYLKHLHFNMLYNENDTVILPNIWYGTYFKDVIDNNTPIMYEVVKVKIKDDIISK